MPGSKRRKFTASLQSVRLGGLVVLLEVVDIVVEILHQHLAVLATKYSIVSP
jgi:hypothetical protein